MTDTGVIDPGLASVRGYRAEPYPRSSSSLIETVIGIKRPIPIKVRSTPSYDPDDFAEPAWLWPAIDRLRTIVKLPPGWDSYSAKPVRQENVEAALQALVTVMSEGSELPWIVPLPSGGIQLEWHSESSDIEIALDGADSSICIDDDEIPHGIGQWPAALTEIRRRLTP
jgi:hypothetical protein